MVFAQKRMPHDQLFQYSQNSSSVVPLKQSVSVVDRESDALISGEQIAAF